MTVYFEASLTYLFLPRRLYYIMNESGLRSTDTLKKIVASGYLYWMPIRARYVSNMENKYPIFKLNVCNFRYARDTYTILLG